MPHPNVHALSKKYGPPTIDIRTAHIMDMYGYDGMATHPIRHVVPEDVTYEDLDFYFEDFCYMKFDDLLFYLYPVALVFERDNRHRCIDWYMWSLDRCVPGKSKKLPARDQFALNEGVRWIWLVGPEEEGNYWWDQCPNLKKLIGASKV